MRHYCTYFDKYYMAAGVALATSLERMSEEPFTLWVLALDEDTRHAVDGLGLPAVRIVPLQALEHADHELVSVKSSRPTLEYYFTCTASWIAYLFETQPAIDTLTYLDADLLFFSHPGAIHEQLGDSNVLIVEHGAPASARIAERFGRFNVGLIVFCRGTVTTAILARWREQCVDWCHARIEPDRFGDQKYLDDWPERYAGVAIASGPAAGIAPWNWQSRRVSLQAGTLCVDGVPLVHYHFHGFRLITRHIYDSGLTRFEPMPALYRKWLYDRYAIALLDAAQVLARHGVSAPLGPATRWGSSSWHLMRLAAQVVRGRGLSLHVVPRSVV